MGFNKKRACCCGTPTPGSDDFYFELFTKIPIAAAERTESGTYSYWVKVNNVDTLDGVPVDSTVIFEHFEGNYASEVGFDVTLVIWKSLEGGLVVIPPRTNFFVYKPGEPPLALTNSFSLRYRGFHMKSSSRLLTENDWDDLDEIKFRVGMPNITEAGGMNKFNTVRQHGYFFGNNQYDQEPAIGPTTFGNLTYEMYPKVAANNPVKEAGLFDFSALFPSSFSFEIDGDFPIAYRKSIPQPPNAPPDFDSLSVSKTFTFSKQEYTPQGPTPGYFPNVSGQQYIDNGGKTIEWTYDLFGETIGPFIVTLRAETAAFVLGLDFGTRGQIASCVTDIGFNQGANLVRCNGCDKSADRPGTNFNADCFGGNFPGSVLGKNKAYAHIFPGAAKSLYASIDILDPANFPSGSGMTDRQLNGIGASPVLAWGPATGETVELELIAPSSPGYPSFRNGGGQLTCHIYDGSPGPYVFGGIDSDGSARSIGIQVGQSTATYSSSLSGSLGTLIQTD